MHRCCSDFRIQITPSENKNLVTFEQSWAWISAEKCFSFINRLVRKSLLFSGRGNVFKYSANIATTSQSQTTFAEAQMNNSSQKKRFSFSIFCVLFVILCCWMRTLSHTLMIDDTLIVHDYVVFWAVLYLENVQIRKMIFRFLSPLVTDPLSSLHSKSLHSVEIASECLTLVGVSIQAISPTCKLLKAFRKWKEDFFKNLQRPFTLWGHANTTWRFPNRSSVRTIKFLRALHNKLICTHRAKFDESFQRWNERAWTQIKSASSNCVNRRVLQCHLGGTRSDDWRMNVDLILDFKIFKNSFALLYKRTYTNPR